MQEFTGRVALVTGGARGLGAAICARFAREGAHVVVADRDLEPAEDVAQELTREGLSAFALGLDVTDAQAILASVETVRRKAGPVDVLVNNAGISRPHPFLETSEEEWDQHHSIILKGAFLMCKAVLPAMVERRSGRIVNMGSALGRQGMGGYAAYATAKFGIVGLTQVLANEFGRHDITANCVVPGIVKTRMWSGEDGTVANTYGSEEAAEAFLQAMIPLGRAQTPEDVAEMVAFLASDKAKNITAATFHVDGGLAPR